MDKLNRIATIAILFILSIFSTFQISQRYFDHQLKVIYSLDKRQNDQEIIHLINDARKYVYFAVFTFTKDDIADALIKAKQRGLIVWGITDTGQNQTEYEKPTIDKLRTAGVAVETQKHLDGIMHIKAIVTDKAYAMGSYNWTEAATEANDELLEVGTNSYLHDQYFEIIKRILLTNQ